MGIKENFTQAVKELTGGKEKELAVKLPVEELKKAVEDDGIQQPREITLNGTTPDVTTYTPVEAAEPAESDATPATEAFFSGGEVPAPTFAQEASIPQSGFSRTEAPVAESVPGETSGAGLYNLPAPTPMPNLRAGRNDDNEITVISRNTYVDGNIRSFADMSVDGDIRGDVETTKNIDLNGKIVGNVTCNNALMHASQVQGNIRMKGNVTMKRDTLLMGDLMSTYADINGKIKGNLDVVGKADLKGDAVVFGDISASTITVEDGAIIQGYVSTTFLNKEESRNLFPETVVIGDTNG
ncbi:MAG: polymer-forming cytoskeletal protein [Oscillospiraceae bacterium]|nr:polymer-forming cytoskeletal protein [Oscillospiraceae bacterium]